MQACVLSSKARISPYVIYEIVKILMSLVFFFYTKRYYFKNES